MSYTQVIQGLETPDGKRETTNLWGREASDLLAKIKGKERKKKQDTLLLLAASLVEGVPFTAVFSDSRACSRTIHYNKWLKHDEAYREAFFYLCGRGNGEDLPDGIARQLRTRIEDMEAAEAAQTIGRARRKIGLAAEKAVDVLIKGLTADRTIITPTIDGNFNEIEVPDHTERRLNSIALLDRIAELSKGQKVDVTSGGEKIQGVVQLPANEFQNKDQD